MGKITDICKQKRNPSRVSVFIDGEFVCGLDAVTAAAARLAIGDEITSEKLHDVIFDSEVNSGFERAVGYISALPRSKREMIAYLRGKGYDADVINAVISRMEGYRYIDDREYAKVFISSKSKKYGKLRLTAELKKRGVDGNIIKELLTNDDSDDEAYTEVDGALDTARRYLKSHRSADVNKLKRYLAGRGFTWDSIYAAVRALDDNDELPSGNTDDETDGI